MIFGLTRASLPERDELPTPDGGLVYDIRVSARRRSLCLQIERDGAVRAVVPQGVRLHDVRSFVTQHLDWVRSKRQAALAQPAPAPLRFVDGLKLPFLGAHLELATDIRPRARARAQRHGERLLVAATAADAVPQVVERWYRQQALVHATERVAVYAPAVGRAPARIDIRGQKTRWGSCSARGAISLNWRLLQAEPALLDYVVVHELCHLLHAHHGPSFWRAVGRVMPDYAERRAQLRRFGRVLLF